MKLRLIALQIVFIICLYIEQGNGLNKKNHKPIVDKFYLIQDDNLEEHMHLSLNNELQVSQQQLVRERAIVTNNKIQSLQHFLDIANKNINKGDTLQAQMQTNQIQKAISELAESIKLQQQSLKELKELALPAQQLNGQQIIVNDQQLPRQISINNPVVSQIPSIQNSNIVNPNVQNNLDIKGREFLKKIQEIIEKNEQIMSQKEDGITMEMLIEIEKEIMQIVELVPQIEDVYRRAGLIQSIAPLLESSLDQLLEELNNDQDLIKKKQSQIKKTKKAKIQPKKPQVLKAKKANVVKKKQSKPKQVKKQKNKTAKKNKNVKKNKQAKKIKQTKKNKPIKKGKPAKKNKTSKKKKAVKKNSPAKKKKAQKKKQTAQKKKQVKKSKPKAKKQSGKKGQNKSKGKNKKSQKIPIKSSPRYISLNFKKP